MLIVLIIVNNAAVGLVTSLFLKSMTSILKSFASALELLFTSLLAWMLFGIPVSMYTFAAIFIVSMAVYFYSTNPVVNVPRVPADGHSNPTDNLHAKADNDVKDDDTRRFVV